ncbi:SDR family NAD(P)-dependent oxidoreductase [Paraburkholderia unamae]|uniref:NAD(P)-dependent dehydrogenase (Short-subunit alcohol dehydrogenase family) n=1 Tax=Paraburkholderia unamae TaxID=219649 RepID=A0ABX5KIS8_9BURK|nr:SDR family oxidoreductase [Paraburkholderia unamae]PVX81318.1 NAD(P)-dependent dehydrogenase (short-subunit alcohol dehydrogenase family) [Paraburkholderia unamae]RAR57217.1 NAD(P)-dependent dehydrogenase (short-subunit alcohol dehydrogenase family) [Paraburkholderia unamae]CAG9243418.1 Short-chain dehydrogenase/reductase SDR [Paraburkholderia unamae]
MTRVAVVTGGGTGIGRAIAEELLQAGLRPVCMGKDADDDLDPAIEFRKVDVTSAAEVRDAFGDLAEIGVLVNGAGIILHEGAEFGSAGFRKVVDVNLNACQLTTEVALDKLAAARGCVVNIASMWSFFGSARNPAYTASKAGVVGLTRAHAAAFAERGVRVNAVAPGWIETRLSAGALHNPERSASIRARLPLGRWGQPADVARGVKFLCSKDADYITGIVLPIDGGFSIA